MGSKEPKDSVKRVDWKTAGNNASNEIHSGPVTKKRLPKKIRQVPDYYFLPRRSIPSVIAIYGTVIVVWIGAGMVGSSRRSKRTKVSFGS